MKPKTIIAALLGLPMLITACSKPIQSQTSAAPSEDKQATAPSPQDKMLQNSPPAAGTGDTGSATSSTPATMPGAMPPADNAPSQSSSSGKGY
ncbi:MAG TPA: hypothetical protein VFF82_10620 [Rhodocyclaceae bacterium]|nr:hypothetical protein [Rhodocyclaceae bacterium]